MTPFDCSVHTHADLCDGRDTPEAMAAAAFAAGVRHYGVSCHSHTPLPSDEGYVLPADMTAYRAAVLRLREAYAGRMEVLLGLEWDSRSDVSPAGFDYWIGSVHYLPGENGVCYAADLDPESLSACRDEGCGGDGLRMAERYFREVCRVAERKPPILGHIDLITKLNAGNRFFDESAPRYRRAALEALHAADPHATVLEINTGGMARGYRDAPYPALFLLREWRSMGGRVILTSDSHSASTIVYGYDQAAALARAAGFDRCVLLTARGFDECPL
ncbi:PHP domain-containing protein [Dysosmobacter sp.]|uniref:PHP domain-containing protein n=1 Tax=Dysosmobacter sp. TaxID=2591382 RepID=UPI002A8E4CB1|nr:PHP domain-containing protein [Dysosmobacter sp.]MDY3281500.1 PHP domain-containing protein [Dysosmobacter sp.]